MAWLGLPHTFRLHVLVDTAAWPGLSLGLALVGTSRHNNGSVKETLNTYDAISYTWLLCIPVGVATWTVLPLVMVLVCIGECCSQTLLASSSKLMHTGWYSCQVGRVLRTRIMPVPRSVSRLWH